MLIQWHIPMQWASERWVVGFQRQLVEAGMPMQATLALTFLYSTWMEYFKFSISTGPDDQTWILNIEVLLVPYCILPKYQTVTPAGIMRGCISTQASLSITCARPATVVGRSHCFAADLSAALPAVWRYEWRGKRVRRATSTQTWQPPLAIGIISKPLPPFLSLYHHYISLVASSCHCQYFKIWWTQFESWGRMGT